MGVAILSHFYCMRRAVKKERARDIRRWQRRRLRAKRTPGHSAAAAFRCFKRERVTPMSVHLRERPAVRRALRAGLPQRLLPPALRLAAAVLGCLGASAPLLGGLRPLGLCFAMSAPAPYAVYTAAGAALGYLFIHIAVPLFRIAVDDFPVLLGF